MIIEIYGRINCPFCTRTKRLLSEAGYKFSYYDITNDGVIRAELLARNPNAKTVPQIFVGELLIGGFEELVEVQKNGLLEQVIGGFYVAKD
jgi:glutaredoxin 3